MTAHRWAVAALLFLGLAQPIPQCFGQDSAKTNAELRVLRERLGSLKRGSSSAEVLKVLGKPDEVRGFEKDLLDGVRYLGDPRGPIKAEAERWAYGVTEKGMFARVGYVSLDRNGKVICAIPSDSFARADYEPPEQVSTKGLEPLATTGKLTCHTATIKYHPAEGDSSESFETTVTLKNAGTKRFELKHDAAYSPRRFLLVEVYDSAGTMLYRFDEMLNHSTISFDQDKWPVLAIEPGKEVSTPLHVMPSTGFGRLPLGRYSLRVYFPFEKAKYYPSNAVSFEIKEEDRGKERK